MKLFKNVDIKDLESILNKGILSMDECGNDNWGEGKRGNNPTDMVYLFKPMNVGDSFPKYGVALVECDTDAEKSEFLANDSHKNDYEEYITKRVDPDEIVNVYIPEGFMYLVPESIASRVTPCKMSAKAYEGNEYVQASEKTMEMFYRTAPAFDATIFGFFRGVDESGKVIDIYEVKYHL